jgi:hypothetical protein
MRGHACQRTIDTRSGPGATLPCKRPDALWTPTRYDPDYHPKLARKACLLRGATDAELAEHFEIAEATLYRWKNVHPNFARL